MAVKLDKYLTKNFRESEFRCKCRRPDCNAPGMKPSFMEKLQRLRDDWGEPLKPTSGLRCEVWNRLNGGSPKSQHLTGNAADFYFKDPTDAECFAALAHKYGFGGIGTGRHLVHIDDRGYEARWVYDDK